MEKMNDLGETWPMNSCGCDDCMDKKKDKKQEKHYPRESFTTEQIPELKGAQVGQKVRLVIEATVCAVSQGDEYGPMAPGEGSGSPKTRVSLKMMNGSATMQGMAKEDTRTMNEKMDQQVDDFSKTIGVDEEEE